MEIPKKPFKKKEEKEWPGLVVSWGFIIGGLFVLALLLAHAKPERALVCDTSYRAPSLTNFGSCLAEGPVRRRKSFSFFSF